MSEAVEALEKVENMSTNPWTPRTQKMKPNFSPLSGWDGLSDLFLTIRMCHKYQCVTSIGLVIKDIDISALFSPSPLRGMPTAIKILRSLGKGPCGTLSSNGSMRNQNFLLTAMSVPSWKWIPQFQSSFQMTAAPTKILIKTL